VHEDCKDEPYAEMLHALERAGVPAPEVGMDLSDSNGDVLAGAQLVWEKQRIAVLYDTNDHAACTEAGWQCVNIHEMSTDDVVDLLKS